MSNVTNARLGGRTGRVLVSVAVAGIAGLMAIATVGHRPVRAEAQAGPASSLASPTGEDRASTSVFADPSLPSASSVLEHVVDHDTEAAATF